MIRFSCLFECIRGLASSVGLIFVFFGLISPIGDKIVFAEVYADPFEPTVTQQEAHLLEKAVQMASTDLKSAIDFIKQQDLKNSSAAFEFAMGNFYYQDEQLEDAVLAYLGAIEKLPKFRSALNNLGRIYLLQDNPDQAIKVFQDLLRDGQADAQMLILLGHAFVLKEQFLSAESAYRQALLLRPNENESMRGLVQCLLSQQRFREAVALLKEMLVNNPGHKETWSLLANAHLALEAIEDSVIVLEQARRVGKADQNMLAMLGDLYMNRNQPEEAVLVYQEAFSEKNVLIDHLLRAAEALVLIQDEEKARKLLDRFSKLQKNTPNKITQKQSLKHLHLIADIAYLGGDYDSAETRYKKILTQNPLAGDVLLSLAELHQINGMFAEATMVLERAARISGFEVQALIQHAQLEVERSRYPRAVQLLEAAQNFKDQPHVARYLQQVRRLSK